MVLERRTRATWLAGSHTVVSNEGCRSKNWLSAPV